MFKTRIIPIIFTPRGLFFIDSSKLELSAINLKKVQRSDSFSKLDSLYFSKEEGYFDENSILSIEDYLYELIKTQSIFQRITVDVYIEDFSIYHEYLKNKYSNWRFKINFHDHSEVINIIESKNFLLLGVKDSYIFSSKDQKTLAFTEYDYYLEIKNYINNKYQSEITFKDYLESTINNNQLLVGNIKLNTWELSEALEEKIIKYSGNNSMDSFFYYPGIDTNIIYKKN